jgi:hypothetical protein
VDVRIIHHRFIYFLIQNQLFTIQIATDLRSASKQRLTKVIDFAFWFAMSKIPFNWMQNISAYTQSNTNAYRHSTKLATWCWKLLLYLATEVSCF